MNKTNNNKRTKLTQKDGWNKGVFTTKYRTSIYIDEDLGKVLKKKSKVYGGVLSRLINQSLREHFVLVVRLLFEVLPLQSLKYNTSRSNSVQQ